jgi:hypothetical protein
MVRVGSQDEVVVIEAHGELRMRRRRTADDLLGLLGPAPR